jgi:hypothetical protein
MTVMIVIPRSALLLAKHGAATSLPAAGRDLQLVFVAAAFRPAGLCKGTASAVPKRILQHSGFSR